jgi:PAS domain S-box-containing protein
MQVHARMGGRRRFRRRVVPARQRAAAILGRAPLAACALDADGRILDANPALGELLGCAAESLKGRSLATLAYLEDVPLATGLLATVFGEQADRVETELRCVRLDNHKLVWGAWDLSLLRDAWGRPELAIGLVRDRSQAMQAAYERRVFEFMLRTIGAAEDSEAMLADAVKTICHLTRCAMGQVWVPRDGVLVCSPAWHAAGYGFAQLRTASTMLRYEHGEGLPGLVWTTGEPRMLTGVELHDPQRFDRAREADRAGIREVLAVPLATPAGLIAVMELFVTPERVDEPGRLQRISRVLAELAPIIQRKRSEEALAASRRELERGNAALEALISSAAHDLRRPMASLRRSVEDLQRECGGLLGEEGNRYLERISACTLSMRRLLRDLVGLAHLGRSAGQVEEVDLGALVQGIVDDLAAAHPAVEFHVGHLPVVTANPRCLRRLFANLLDNAVRHGGRDDLVVTVAATSHPGGGLELWVADDGQGIPAEQRERAFGVVERPDLDALSSGSGMGLAVCRRLVELLGGSIGIHDGLAARAPASGGPGTEVRMLLPPALLRRWPQGEPEPPREGGVLASSPPARLFAARSAR